MAKSEDKKAVDIFTLPEGRVINQSLFVKDAFDERAVPSYKIEIAIPKDDPGIADLEDRLLDFADDRWGEGASDDENLVIPLLDGDKLAKKREKKGKDGDAYKGMIVIRANTIYNKEGQDGPGGIQVFDPDVEEILPARSSDVFSGCYGEVAVTIGTYEATTPGLIVMSISMASNSTCPPSRRRRMARSWFRLLTAAPCSSPVAEMAEAKAEDASAVVLAVNS